VVSPNKKPLKPPFENVEPSNSLGKKPGRKTNVAPIKPHLKPSPNDLIPLSSLGMKIPKK